MCVCVLGVSVRVPLRVRALSVCVHVVIGCVWGSSQRGWRLRSGRRLLISALVEQHVGRFSLRERKRVQLHDRNTPVTLTPDTEVSRGVAFNASERRKWSDREESSPQSDPLRQRTRCCRQSNTTFHQLYSCRKLCLFRKSSRMNTCLRYNPRTKIKNHIGLKKKQTDEKWKGTLTHLGNRPSGDKCLRCLLLLSCLLLLEKLAWVTGIKMSEIPAITYSVPLPCLHSGLRQQWGRICRGWPWGCTQTQTCSNPWKGKQFVRKSH